MPACLGLISHLIPSSPLEGHLLWDLAFITPGVTGSYLLYFIFFCLIGGGTNGTLGGMPALDKCIQHRWKIEVLIQQWPSCKTTSWLLVVQMDIVPFRGSPQWGRCIDSNLYRVTSGAGILYNGDEGSGSSGSGIRGQGVTLACHQRIAGDFHRRLLVVQLSPRAHAMHR